MRSQISHTKRTLKIYQYKFRSGVRRRDLRVETAVILRIVRYLSPASPDNLASCRDKTQLRHVHLFESESASLHKLWRCQKGSRICKSFELFLIFTDIRVKKLLVIIILQVLHGVTKRTKLTSIIVPLVRTPSCVYIAAITELAFPPNF